ncbi:unnamed protein product [Gadus morhua 'NCC']
MESHNTGGEARSSAPAPGAGSEAAGRDSDLRVVRDRVKLLEQNTSSVDQSDGYLRDSGRITELERSETALLQQLSQLATGATPHRRPSMHHTQRLDQRLHSLRDEVRIVSHEKERGERVWRERLLRCQNQLKAKEEEMGRQSQYFHHFKTQLQHKLGQARDREQGLQNRLHALEKQLLDVTVSAATTMTAVMTTKMAAPCVAVATGPGEDRVPCLREEGEGEEGGERKKKEEEEEEEEEEEKGRTRWPTRPGRRLVAGDSGSAEDADLEKGGGVEEERGMGVAKLQSFILGLQEDLRALLEREEQGQAERRGLSEQLQEAQEGGHLLGCRLEEKGAEVRRLQQSESVLLEEVEELREENGCLRQELRGALGSQTPAPPAPGAGCACWAAGVPPGSPGPGYGPTPVGVSPPGLPHSPGADERATCPPGDYAVLRSDKLLAPPKATTTPHLPQGAAESTLNPRHHCPASADPDTTRLPQPDLLNLSARLQPRAHPGLGGHGLAEDPAELGQLDLEEWGSSGALHLELSPSQEADALMEAYRSLCPGADRNHHQEQQNVQGPKPQLRSPADLPGGAPVGWRSSPGKKERAPTRDPSSDHARVDHAPPPPGQDHAPPAPPADHLVRALNQENRALAERIQELLARVELREEEHAKEAGLLAEGAAAALAAEVGRREREQQEQGGLIAELTRKTEDDLNAIMDLRQRLAVAKEEESARRRAAESEAPGGRRDDGSARGVTAGLARRLGERPSQVDEQTQTCLEQDLPTTDSSTDPFPGDHCVDQGVAARLQVDALGVAARLRVDALAEAVRALSEEKEELSRCVGPLREEQREVALAVQTRTEEKQRLTRTLWGMKEERDGVAAALSALRQEREQLSRSVCGLREEREQLGRSLEELREERGRLGEELSELRNQTETSTSERTSGGGREGVQGDQEDRVELTTQSEHSLNVDDGGLTGSSGGLIEQRETERAYDVSKEERDELLQSVCSLTDERRRVEQSIAILKTEEERLRLSVWSLIEERDVLQAEGAALQDQSQPDGRGQDQHPANQIQGEVAKKTEKENLKFVDNQEKFSQGGLDPNSHQNDLMRQTEALAAALKTTKEELIKAQSETQRLGREQSGSEARLGELEKASAQADREKKRLTDSLEETRQETELLTTRVKDLQSRLAGLAREKDEALTQKTHTEEQFSILQAQLRAKTLALDGLNSEYTALRREQQGDPSPASGSLRSRYNDIRAKYDVLLRKKSLHDMDLAPLKAKLSCLVLKCQERNSLLVHMMRAMRRQGYVDPALTQQADDLLSDPALQDYTAAFPPAAPYPDLGHHHHHHLQPHQHTPRATSGFASRLRDYSAASSPAPPSPDPAFSSSTSPTELQPPGNQSTSPVLSGPVLMHNDRGTDAGGRRGTPAEPARDVQSAAGSAPTRNPKSPGPCCAVREHTKARPPASPGAQSHEGEGPRCSPAASSKPQSPAVPSGTSQADASLDRPGSNHEDEILGGKPASGPAPVPRATRSRWAPPPSERWSGGVNRRLSSPEKILNLQLELQQTLSGIYKAPADHGGWAARGRRPQPRRSASTTATPEHHPASLPRTHSMALHTQPPPPPPPPPPPLLNVSPDPVQTKPLPMATTATAAASAVAHLSNTLSAAVFSRSANMAPAFAPCPSNMAPAFPRSPSNMAFGTTTAGRSGSFPLSSTDDKANLRSSVQNTPESPRGPRHATIPASANATSSAPSPAPTCRTDPPNKTLRKTATVGASAPASSVQPFTGNAPSATASDGNNNNNNTAPSVPRTGTQPPATPSASGASDGAGDDRRASTTIFSTTTTTTTTSTTRVRADSACSSPPGRSQPRPLVGLPAPTLTGKLGRPKPEAPGEVGTVEVIRTVGGSSLLIGWERPPLDELGCSNGTFVYGYRVYVDGEFHKSVMSSACTKVILENVDLSLPVHIGVQTLGSNGLSSGRVTTVFRTSLSPGPGSPGAAGPGLPTAEALELRETVGL